MKATKFLRSLSSRVVLPVAETPGRWSNSLYVSMILEGNCFQVRAPWHYREALCRKKSGDVDVEEYMILLMLVTFKTDELES